MAMIVSKIDLSRNYLLCRYCFHSRMKLSLLVVSCTPELLSRMLASVPAATTLALEDLEVLCSWNGLDSDESLVDVPVGLSFAIVCRDPYHFAANMNYLALQANAEHVVLINDDVILDPISLDVALLGLHDHPESALVASRLRGADGGLTHAGILFHFFHSPYHALESLVSADHQLVSQGHSLLTAATGALIAVRRSLLMQWPLNEAYRVCGEDVELCLDLLEHVGARILYLPQFSGVHQAESTRRRVRGQSADWVDQRRLRLRHRSFQNQADPVYLKMEWMLNFKLLTAYLRFGLKSWCRAFFIVLNLARLSGLILWRILAPYFSIRLA